MCELCTFSQIWSHNYIDGKHLFSSEGTTQGDPLAMAIYATSVIPLINAICDVMYSRRGLQMMPLRLDPQVGCVNGGLALSSWVLLMVTM